MLRTFFLALISVLISFAGASAAFASPSGETGAPAPWQLNFQPPASINMEKIENFHDILLVIITVITIFVLLLLAYVCFRFREKANPTPSNVTHNTVLEIVWTALPIIILTAICIPSLKLLYFNDRTPNAEMTLKVIGYQWYWGYEYPESNVAFESYIIKDKDIQPNQIRLLEVDNRIVLPVDTNIRIQTTAADVIHSWAVPALGVKIDAVPGRLNETWVNISKEGVYRGQCSELCGAYHGFMPVVVEAVSKEKFAEWVKSKGDASATEAQPAAAPEVVLPDAPAAE